MPRTELSSVKISNTDHYEVIKRFLFLRLDKKYVIAIRKKLSHRSTSLSHLSPCMQESFFVDDRSGCVLGRLDLNFDQGTNRILGGGGGEGGYVLLCPTTIHRVSLNARVIITHTHTHILSLSLSFIRNYIHAESAHAGADRSVNTRTYTYENTHYLN